MSRINKPVGKTSTLAGKERRSFAEDTFRKPVGGLLRSLKAKDEEDWAERVRPDGNKGQILQTEVECARKFRIVMKKPAGATTL